MLVKNMRLTKTNYSLIQSRNKEFFDKCIANYIVDKGDILTSDKENYIVDIYTVEYKKHVYYIKYKYDDVLDFKKLI